MKIMVITQGKIASGAEIITSTLYSENKEKTIIVTGNEKQSTFFKSHGYKVKEINGLVALNRENFKYRILLSVLNSLLPLRKCIKEFEPDYIHVNNIPSLLYAKLASIGMKKRILLHVHDFYTKDNLVTLFCRFLKNTPFKIVAVSKKVSEDLLKLKFNSEKITVIHNGIDILYDTLPETRAHNKKVKIGFVGSISRWKGLHVLLEAIGALNDIEAEYLIIGPFVDEAYEKEVKEIVKRINQDVQFLGHRNDARTLMASLDILVHCSIEDDPFPTVLLEGMHSGCAVIGSNCGGVPEIIEHGQTGLIHEKNSYQDLSEQLRHLILNKKLRDKVAEKGYIFAKSYLSSERYRNEFHHLVQK